MPLTADRRYTTSEGARLFAMRAGVARPALRRSGGLVVRDWRLGWRAGGFEHSAAARFFRATGRRRRPQRISQAKGDGMKIVVIGGTGLIGTKLVEKLRADGHEAVAASPDTGVDTLTGEGLAEALEGARVVVDVANAPDWDDGAVMTFFQTTARNLLAAETAAGVGHHVVLSVVGADRLQDSGYLRAKVAQEDVIKAGHVPYTILRASQFFEFVGRIADAGVIDDTVHLAPVLVQPEAADDVAATLADIAVNAPLNGTVELAGPERFRLDELAERFLRANDDPREVTADAHARYFGAELDEQSLTPHDTPRIAPTHFDDWLGRSVTQRRTS
jgi:uncharacterized protein YbjT (DUF2867 family)